MVEFGNGETQMTRARFAIASFGIRHFAGARLVFFMPDLFDEAPESKMESTPASAPLSTRMRPRTLDEFAGQEHIVGPGKLLRRAIEADRISSIILYGPPGTGKTTLAQIIANATQSKFERLSGVESTVADMRRAIATAPTRLP